MNPPTATTGEVCRLMFYGPESRVELAVPAHVPLSDLLPTILSHLGPELATAGLGHSGWVLQRLGEPALDEQSGVAALGLRDGDVVYLRPRDDQLPPADFDDMIDGVATGISQRPRRWRPELSRYALLASAVVCLGLLLLLVPPAGSGLLAPIALVAASALMLLGAAASARVLDDRVAATILACISVGFAAAAGLAIPASGGLSLSAPGLLAAGSAATAVALVARAAIGGLSAGLASVALCTAVTSLGAALAMPALISTAGAAALTSVLALGLAAMVPPACARAAGLRLAPLPTNADELQENVDPEPGRAILAATARADTLVSALYAGLGAVHIGCLTVLAASPGWAAPAFIATVASVLLLQSRDLLSAMQRLALLAPGVYGLAALAVYRLPHLPGLLRLPAGAALLLAGAGLLVASRRLPGRRLVPYWGRAGDILQTMATIAAIPLALAVLNIYGLARAGWA